MLQFNQTTDNSTLSARMVGLRPYTNYSCCISAITSVAKGTKACTNTITSEAGRYAVELKRLHFVYVHTTLFLFLLSTHCCSTESKRQCNWLHLIVSLLEPPTFTAPEWENSILPHPCD